MRFEAKTKDDELQILSGDNSLFLLAKDYLRPLISESLDQFEFEDRKAVEERLLELVAVAGHNYLHDPKGAQVDYSFATYFSWYIGDVLSKTHRPTACHGMVSVSDLHQLFAETVALLETSGRDKAGIVFNTRIRPRYGVRLNTDVFSPITPFYVKLNEYLNSPGARMLGVANKEDVIGSFYSDFREEYAEALRLEREQTESS